MIYFVQRANDRAIKIGTTIRLSQRIKALRAAFGDCEILAVMDGSYADEAALHAQFDPWSVAGEWFSDAAPLLAFIEAEGKPWDGTDEVAPWATVKVDTEVVEDCRIAASFCKMSLAEYLSERMRVSAKKDIDEGYARRTATDKPPKGKGTKH